MSVFRVIHTAEELLQAVSDKTVRYLILRNDLQEVPSFRMLPYQSIVGEFAYKKIKFQKSIDGICLSKGNELKNLIIQVDPDKRAIWQDTEVTTMSTHHLIKLNVTGLISFIIEGAIKKGKIEAGFIHFDKANTFMQQDHPSKYGVEVKQGAFTLWNKQEDETVVVNLNLNHLSCGSANDPIKACGILLCGAGEMSGSVLCPLLSCGKMYTHGSIAQDTPDQITAAVAIGHTTTVNTYSQLGEITTSGNNDMGINNWGNIHMFIVNEVITTKGENSSAIVNAGNITKLMVMKTIETFATGSRGFYMYDGNLVDADFYKIITHGDAATAMHVGRYADRIVVSDGIETHGNAIDSLFSDVIIKLPSDGVSVGIGSTIKLLRVTGGIVTNGKAVRSIYDAGSIERLFVEGNVVAKGEESNALFVHDAFLSAESVNFISDKSVAIVLEKAKMINLKNLTAKGKDMDIEVDVDSSYNHGSFIAESVVKSFNPDVRIHIIK